MADARNNIAKLIEIKVDSMFKTFKSTTGTAKGGTMDKAIETVSKQIASRTLKGTKVKETWISRSGTLYVLMVIDTKAVIDMMDKSAKTSFKNDKAMYQKFLASKAQGELEKELEKHNARVEYFPYTKEVSSTKFREILQDIYDTESLVK